MNTDLSLVFLGLLVFFAHLFASIFSKRMIPDVLLLIIVGLLIGPVLGLISPEQLGVVGPVFVAVTLVFILFEGGTSLSVVEMQRSWKSTMSLTSVCFLCSVLIIGLIAYFFFHFSLISALILGSILGGTSSAVVIPLVRQLDMGKPSRTVLILESAITDVYCIVFTLAFLEAYKMGHVNVGLTFGNIFSSFALAGLMGFLGAIIWARVLARIRKMQNSIFTTPAFVFIIYGITQVLGYSGAISALAFGITIANLDHFRQPFIRKMLGKEYHKLDETELVFFGEIVFLVKTFFFVYIGISIVFDDINAILAGLLITLAVFVLRFFLTNFLSPKKSTAYDKSIISLMVPKGLAAAVLATIPAHEGVPEGELIKNITYAVVFMSITLTAILIITLNKSVRVKDIYLQFFSKKHFTAKQESHEDINDQNQETK